MEEISIKKKGWKDITLTDYDLILKINERPYDSDLEKSIALASLLCGVAEDDLYSIEIEKLKGILNDMEWIKKPFTFDRNWKPSKMNIAGIKCKVFPDINSLTVAQFLDFQTFWNERNEHKGELLAVFIVPEGKKYNEGYSATEFAATLENNISIQEWNSFCFFLLRRWVLSIRASLHYSRFQMTKMIWTEKDPKEKETLRQQRKEITEAISFMRRLR